MQINPGSPKGKHHFPSGKAGESVGKHFSNISGADATDNSNETNIVDLVGRLSTVRLIELLNNNTGNRAEVVDQAREKLNTGEYLLPESASRAADSILGLLPADGEQTS